MTVAYGGVSRLSEPQEQGIFLSCMEAAAAVIESES